MVSLPPFPTPSPAWHLFVPKLFTILRQGYSLDWFRHDLVSGLTAAIVALPLAMALAIASGTTPDKGFQPQPAAVLTDMHILNGNRIVVAKTYAEAVRLAGELVGKSEIASQAS